MAQGQLPIEASDALPNSTFSAWLYPTTSPIKAVQVEHQSRQRSPPSKPY
jgi:hypothetical protein